MPTSANRIRAFLLAFNEVSWIDILNGYHFRYEALGVHPNRLEAAQRALNEIAAAPRRGIPPLEWQFTHRPAAPAMPTIR